MKLKNLVMALAATAAFTACSSGDENPNTIIEYVPIQIEHDSKWSMIGPDGELLYDSEFKNAPTPVVNGFFSVLEGKHISVYKAETGGPKLLSGCDDLEQAGTMMEGLMPVVRDKHRITVIDTNGDIVFTLEPVKKKEITACMPYFSNGMLIAANEDGKQGCYNKKGEVVIDFKYDVLYPFCEGYAFATKTNNGKSKTSIIDTNGEVVATVKSGYSVVSMGFVDGLAVVKSDDDRYAFINTKGEINRLSAKVKGVYALHKNNFIYINDNDKYGIMNLDGEKILAAKYVSLSYLDNGNLLAQKDEGGSYYIINEDGERIEKISDHKSVYAMATSKFGLLAVNDRDEANFLDLEGKPTSKIDFVNAITYVEADAIYSRYESKKNTPAVEEVAVAEEAVVPSLDGYFANLAYNLSGTYIVSGVVYANGGEMPFTITCTDDLGSFSDCVYYDLNTGNKIDLYYVASEDNIFRGFASEGLAFSFDLETKNGTVTLTGTEYPAKLISITM
ncbi:MAG: WG repeat-containing protein [Bacteroides sp.]|nr:WG repeat-containing protein [Bacteroides sp.]MCM1413898.1 WG repeat-containing protein [Bacteroides sp.]